MKEVQEVQEVQGGTGRYREVQGGKEGRGIEENLIIRVNFDTFNYLIDIYYDNA